MNFYSKLIRCFPLSAILSLFCLVLLPREAAAQRDTVRLQAINDTLALNILGDTLSVINLCDTTLVIVNRDYIYAIDSFATDTADAAIALNYATPRNRNFFEKMLDASKVALKQTSVKVGLNVGATAPFGLPENSTVLSFAPIFAPSISIEKKFPIHGWFYALAGLRFEYKGMKTRAGVQDFQTEVPQESGGTISIVSGAFTGENVTKVVMSYFSIPVRMGFQITKNYALEAGGFVALAMTRGFGGKVEKGYLWTHPSDTDPTSGKILVESADYEFSSETSKFDAGVELYGSHHLGANIMLDAGLGVGLIPIFDNDKFKGIPFSMYNIYLNVAIGYRFN